MNETVIGFTPSLPCASTDGDRRCGKDATVATIYPVGGGQYLMQPFCQDCAAKLAKIYLSDHSAAGAEQKGDCS